MRVIFILPGRGGGGGAHSVVQEAMGLKRLGVDVSVAASRETAALFRETYPELDRHRIPNPLFDGAEDLAGVIAGQQIAVATTALSAVMLAEVLGGMDAALAPRPAYYVQDYEPLFMPPGGQDWAAARASYTASPGALLFAKTDWLCDIVNRNHNVAVRRVKASIDHATYHPDATVQTTDVIRVSAMVRPRTPRRAPRRTIRILERIAAEFGTAVEVSTFGCTAEELAQVGLKSSSRIQHLGILQRRQVADLLRSSDLFLDLSDFQAFGRTGLEGMACGCVPVLPVFGGATEYARHRHNAYLVDTRSDEEIMAAVREFAANGAAMRRALRMNAIDTALDYSIDRAAFSEYRIFDAYLGG